MNRMYALLIPVAFLFTACGPGEVGDDCDSDEDCDVDNGIICDLGAETGEDAEGVCQEEAADPTQE